MMDQVKDYGGVAREVHGDAERRAAARRGLGGDRRVRAGDARPPGLRVPGRRSTTRASFAAATIATQVGHEVHGASATPIATREDAERRPCRATSSPTAGDVLDFAAPILFQGKTIGSGAPRHLRGAARRGGQPDARAARDPDRRDRAPPWRSARYLLAQRLARRCACCATRSQELANGRYDYRISETRKDEFGELYADVRQDRRGPASSATSRPRRDRRRHPGRDGRRRRQSGRLTRCAVRSSSSRCCSSPRARRRRHAARGTRPVRCARRTGPVLGRDDDFIVVVARAGDDFATLAERYLGDRVARVVDLASSTAPTRCGPAKRSSFRSPVAQRRGRLRRRRADGADPLLSPLRHAADQARDRAR